jgi:DNA helicase-2/ATP-dependent DNA helicase PcrA
MTGHLFNHGPEQEAPDPCPKPGGLDFRSLLNPAQYEAVTTINGPVLVVAGAGSGKTRTLVHRVAFLVEQGVPPEAILLLTFTRKSAEEMLRRAGALVGSRCARVSGGTFHALAHELLRHWGHRLGYPNTFGVMDRGDMEEVLGQLRRSAGMGDKDRRFPRRATLATIISKAANKNLAVEKLVVEEYVHLKGYLGDIVRLTADYASFKKENALLDFDDLLIQLNNLLAADEETRREIASRYQYIMVDEYQDTNLVQAEIIRHLARDHGNIMVVGDDAQSIYSFRGATFRNIMDFPLHFPGARVIALEENYRSRQPILSLTNHIISRSREKYDKKLFTRREGGVLPRVLVVSSQMEQSQFVCRKVRELAAQGVELSRMAVLFRAARHSFKLEVELARQEIDFVKYGGRRFLEAAHIKDLLCLLRVAANPSDGVSLTRSLLLLDGVGPRGAANLVAWTKGQREKLLTLDQYPASAKVTAALKPLAELFKEIGASGVGLNERVDRAWAYYRPVMESRFDDHPSRQVDIQEFLSLARTYTSLKRFLADMALEPPNASGPRGGGNTTGKLTLSTVHSAKGLEWHAVFIIWATDGHLPPLYALDSPESVDEERRLLYVAATRAEDLLYIICPLEEDYGGGPMMRPRPSRFLEDVPPSLVALRDDEASAKAPRPVRPAGNSTPASVGGLGEGQRVTHPVFGLGRVLRLLEGDKIRVDFDHFGTKTLALKYAGLKNAGD